MKPIILFLTFIALSGCATIREHCKNSADPSACQARTSLGVLSCEAEAKRKTPVVRVATGVYHCNGGISGSGGNYSTNSTCRPEFKDTQDRELLRRLTAACIDRKEREGKFK